MCRPYTISIINMKLKTLILSKTLKIGLPQYSSVAIGCSLEVEIEEKEKPDYKSLWARINLEIDQQAKRELEKYTPKE